MPVDEDINLDAPEGITQEEIDKMNKQADEIEKIADRTEKNVNRIQKATQSPMEKIFGGKAFSQLNEEETKQFQDMIIDYMKQKKEDQDKIQENTENIEENREDIEEVKQKLWEIKTKDISDLKSEFLKTRSSFQNGFSDVMGTIKNPVGRGMGFLRGIAMGGAGAVLPLTALFIGVEVGKMVYDTVISEVKSWYEAGGIFDRRKVVLDEMKQIANLDHMLAIHRGDLFFTSDTAEFIRQGISQNDSNARTRIYGHKQYIQEFDR